MILEIFYSYSSLLKKRLVGEGPRGFGNFIGQNLFQGF